MNSYYIEDVKSKRERLVQSVAAKPFIDEILKTADEAISEVSPAFKMSDYVLYFQNGNRSVFEKGYFARRRKCNSIMIAYWLTEDDKYFVPLIDYINYICDEFSWCLPAHSEYPTIMSKATVEHVDLFQAETARFFAEIVMCVGDKLPHYVLDRMEYEIRRRIFPTFEKNEALDVVDSEVIHKEAYWWENCEMNWATVCGAGCTMAALCFGTDEEKEKYVNRFIGCLDSYLDGIEDDGCCQEGMAYWGYGFGHFVILAHAVKVYSNGKIDYFKNPKVRELALFPQRVRMSDSKVASISDGGEVFSFKIGLYSFLKFLYPEISLPDLKYGSIKGNVDSVFELLWFDENYQSQPRMLGTDYLKNAHWYISKRQKYSFVAKGGHNNEPHNHNDIGSFMITVGDETFISDLGCGEYVKETFMAETRYGFVQNSSRGHSVPIINGVLQEFGKEYCSKNEKVSDNSFELDIEGAYPQGTVSKIKRRFILSDDKVVLNDSFVLSSDSDNITERFVSKIKPDIDDGVVNFGIAKILYDSHRYKVSVSTESYVSHNAVDIIDVYLIDFEAIDDTTKEFEFEFKM